VILEVFLVALTPKLYETTIELSPRFDLASHLALLASDHLNVQYIVKIHREQLRGEACLATWQAIRSKWMTQLETFEPCHYEQQSAARSVVVRGDLLAVPRRVAIGGLACHNK
jgi:hypothetical protein